MDPEGIGGSAWANPGVLSVIANRASVIRQDRGERSEIVIAGLRKGPPARGPMGCIADSRSSMRKGQADGEKFNTRRRSWPPYFGTGNGARLSPRAKRHQGVMGCQLVAEHHAGECESAGFTSQPTAL